MDWIEEQYNKLEQHKLELDMSIKEIKLLFKPWPAKRKKCDSDSKPNEASAGGEVSEQRASVLTAEEEEGVALVDNLLKKANKAREVQKRLEEPKKSRVKEPAKLGVNKTGKVADPTLTSQAQHDSEKSTSDTNTKPTDTRTTGVRKVDNQIAGTNSKTSTNLSVKATTNQSRNSGVKSASSNTSSLSDKSQRARTSQRPQSTSGQKRVVPTHANAPFQTNPRLASSKMQTTYRAATTKTVSKARQASTGLGSRGRGAVGNSSNSRTSKILDTCVSNKSSSGIGSDIGAKDIHARTAEYVLNHTKTEEDIDSGSNMEHDDSISPRQQFTHDNTKRTKHQEPVENITSNLQSLNIEDKAVEHHSEETAAPEIESKLFSLARDGTSLKVPGKLKKLVYQNRKLREKLYTQTVTQKVDSPDQPCSVFPQHLEHSFGNDEAKTTQLQARQAEYLLNVYTSLHDLLNSLRLDNISPDTDVADVYRCKKLMEYILTTFQEMEQLLHQSDFRLLHSAKTCAGNTDQFTPVPQYHSSMVWYDKCKSKAPGPAPILKYSNYRELERYMDVVFKIQLLQLQIDTREHIADMLLPLLGSQDPSSSEFIHTLRAGYSLLSQNRNRMPVVIKDTIGEESDEEQ